MASDLSFVFRRMRRQRAFTAVTVLTLALGIGAAVSIFSVTDWILFRESRFPADVFLVGGQSDESPSMPIRFDFMVRAYKEGSNAISEWAKAASMVGNIEVDGQPLATNWLGVSSNLFPMLGISPGLGRGFLPGEDVEGSDRVVIVSRQFWQKHLGGRADALGRTIRVGDAVCTVVGVLRPSQALPPYFYQDVFRPLAYRYNPKEPWMPNLFVLGRLHPGFTREEAQRALQAVKIDAPPELSQFLTHDRPVLSSMGELDQVMHVEIYWVMLGAVIFLYAIACLNASNLMLVRMLGQRRELSIRLALGGGRWRIIRLLAVESLVLSILASLAGALIATWFFPLLLRAAGDSFFTVDWTSWELNWGAMVVPCVLTVATSLVIVAVPAVRVLRADISAGLKDGGAALGESRALGRIRGSFVVLQAAFAVILLAGAGLMIQTLHNLEKVDLGFDPAGRAKVQLSLPPDYPTDWIPCLARLHEIQAELQGVPGVQAADFGTDVLLPGYFFPTETIAGPGGKPVRAAMAGFNIGYQDASGLVLRRGRWLSRQNGNEIMVNESLARALWPGQDPVGRLVRPERVNESSGGAWKGWVVDGVVGDVRATVRDAPGPYIYGPEGWGPRGFTSFIVRLSRNYDEAFAGLIRKKLYAYDRRIVVTEIQPLSQLRDNQLWAERMANSVLKVLAGIALTLTVVGIFSVLAYTVDRRMGEFGVRMALGATRRDLVGLVLQRGVSLTCVGIVLGLGGALALTRYLQSLLFKISSQDPLVLGAVGVILLLTSVAACLLPARRAARADVSRLLKSE